MISLAFDDGDPRGRRLEELVASHGGRLRNGASGVVHRLAPTASAGAGDLTILLDRRHLAPAIRAIARGAVVLVDDALAAAADVAALSGWFHPRATSALAELLERVNAPETPPTVGEGSVIAPGVQLLPRVRIGARVTIAPGAVIGAAGFGWILGGSGEPVRAMRQLGGVVIEDDVHIGALCTIASGTIGPTLIRRGAKLDAQVHVGHNCEIGEHTMIAAQTGLAGSVVVGRGVLIGGQVGIADHLRIGDGARIAAKSGVIGDVPAGATYAGYPAVDRPRWLRGLATVYRLAASRSRRLAEVAS